MNYEYYNYLLNLTSSYKGEDSKYINSSPDLFKLFNKLTLSNEINNIHKKEIFISLGYFIASEDIIPEDIFGAKGLIDDLLLMLFVLDRIKDAHGIDVIFDFWDKEFKILEELINEGYNSLKIKHSDTFLKTLEFTCINK